MSMTVLRKHVNILNGFNKVKQQTGDTSEGNMKHLKLGKIQWIALLVVSAMFVNLCSHMVLAAARDGNAQAQETTETTTVSESTTELQRHSRKRHSLWENIKHSGFLSTIMTLIVQNIKRERQQISVPTLQVLSKKERVLE